MEHIFVSNGSTMLVLVPENDLDRLLMEKIMSDGPVEIEYIRQPVGILGKSVKDGVIIRKKSNTISDDRDKAESLPWLQGAQADMEESR